MSLGSNRYYKFLYCFHRSLSTTCLWERNLLTILSNKCEEFLYNFFSSRVQKDNYENYSLKGNQEITSAIENCLEFQTALFTSNINFARYSFDKFIIIALRQIGLNQNLSNELKIYYFETLLNYFTPKHIIEIYNKIINEEGNKKKKEYTKKNIDSRKEKFPQECTINCADNIIRSFINQHSERVFLYEEPLCQVCQENLIETETQKNKIQSLERAFLRYFILRYFYMNNEDNTKTFSSLSSWLGRSPYSTHDKEERKKYNSYIEDFITEIITNNIDKNNIITFSNNKNIELELIEIIKPLLLDKKYTINPFLMTSIRELIENFNKQINSEERPLKKVIEEEIRQITLTSKTHSESAQQALYNSITQESLILKKIQTIQSIMEIIDYNTSQFNQSLLKILEKINYFSDTLEDKREKKIFRNLIESYQTSILKRETKKREALEEDLKKSFTQCISN